MNWRPVVGTDIPSMVDVGYEQIVDQVQDLFVIDTVEYARQLTMACVNQFYNPGSELLYLAENHNHMLGYVWARRGETAPWSRDEMVTVRLVHVDRALPVRQRIAVIDASIDLWETWARSIGVPVICSTSMRERYQGYMTLHQRRGYSVRGSIAYKRIGENNV